MLLADLDAVFRLHWIVLLPAVIVVWSIVQRMPPAFAIAMSSAVAILIGVVVQGFTAGDALAAAVAGFRSPMVAATGTDPAALTNAFLRLVERGGLYSTSTTLIVVISAFLLAAGMDVSGALDLIIARMLAAVRPSSGS